MIGLRPRLTLGRGSTGFIQQPARLERISHHATPPRAYNGGLWTPRWSETIGLQVKCADLANEMVQSKWLHQPFIVRGINQVTDGSAATGIQWIVVPDSADIATALAALRHGPGLIDQYDEEDTLAEISTYLQSPPAQPHTLYQRTPTRLTLVVSNNSGAAQTVMVTVCLTYLAPTTHDAPRLDPTNPTEYQVEPQG